MIGFSERPAIFGRARHLIGTECRPTAGAASPDVPAVLFVNAGTVHRVGPHRIYVTLARALAEVGVPSLRFDLSGVGDSRVPEQDVGTRLEGVRADLHESVGFLQQRMGAAGVLGFGLCSGADHAFDLALEDDRVVGAVLLDTNVHVTRGYRRRRLRAAAGRASTWGAVLTGRHPSIRGLAARVLGHTPEEPEVVRPGLVATELPDRETRGGQIRALLERGVALHYIFTGGVLERFNGPGQLAEAYPESGVDEGASLAWLPDAEHTFASRASQQELVRLVIAWTTREFPASGAADTEGRE